MSEGTASAQRFNEALDIQARQREFMDSVRDEDDEPMNRGDLMLLLGVWVGASAFAGLALYGAYKLAEGVR